MRRGIFEERMVELVARIASGLADPSRLDLSLFSPHVAESILNVGLRLRGESPVYCKLCGRGPFSKKGYYLHLRRIHYQDILRIVRDEIERVGRASKL